MTDQPQTRTGSAAAAWRTLRGYENPERYRDVAGAEQTPTLARPPAALTEAIAEEPAGVRAHGDARTYVAHSCDLTLSGGLDTAIAAPLAACALAEHYVLRRIGGAGPAALAAAAVAAAEHGRTRGAAPVQPSPGTSDPSPSPGLNPGYPGLAQVTGWLAGDRDNAWKPRNRERIARLLQPSPALHRVHGLLVAATRPRRTPGRRWTAITIAALRLLTAAEAAVVALVWIGVVLAWIGLTVALARSPTVAGWVVVLVTPALLVTVVLAGLAATALVAALAARRVIGADAEAEFFGLVPGVPVPAPEGSRPRLPFLDRLIGVPDPAGVPPLTTWFADALDDLAAVPSGADDRHALTFGDLWLGHPADEADLGRLRRAAADPEQRVLELRLAAADVTRGMAVALPFPEGSASGWLLCPDCWLGVLPGRVVDQVLMASPEPAAQVCPRHGTHLRPVPPPWALPVVVAARMAAGVPGLLRSVPLHRATGPDAGPLRNRYGAASRRRPDDESVGAAVTTHWLTGSAPAEAPVAMFDTAVPRWPTVALSVVPEESTSDAGEGPWVQTPGADDAPAPMAPPAPVDAVGFARAVLRAPFGWRVRTAAAVPDTRNRTGVVRRGVGASRGLFLTDGEVLRLALRGSHAGQELRERFTGPDGEIEGQTGVDRYRWIRIRSALRNERRDSLAVAAGLPVLNGGSAPYRIPGAVASWFTPPLTPGRVDPNWVDAAAALSHLRTLTSGGVLDWDTDYGAPPADPDGSC